MRRSNVGGLFFGVALTIGCSSQPSGETLGHNSAAASGADGGFEVSVDGGLPDAPPFSTLQLFAGPIANGYVGVPLSVFEEAYNFDTTTTHNDVTLKITIAGSFTAGILDGSFGYDPTWACSQDGGTPLTITCHADQVMLKDGVTMPITPTALGTITIDSHLTEGGVEVGNAHFDVPIIVPGADVAIFGGGGGKVPVGQQGFASFNVLDWGPLAATGTTATFTLTGPGKIVAAGAGFPLPPPGFPPPPPPPPPPGATSCTFTDTTATCAIGDLAVWGNVPVNVVFQGIAEGNVTITASVSANEADPVPKNNAASASFIVFRPHFADLSVSMSVTPSAPKFKKPMSYLIVVHNNGPDAATDAILQDFLPTNVTFDTITTTQGSCFGNPFVFCDLGALAAGASATITVTGTPTEGGTLANSAFVYDPYADTDLDLDFSNNSTSLTTTVSGPNPPVTTTSTETMFETSFGAYVDCAHDFVVLTGTMHDSLHTTFNKSSGRAKYDSTSHPSAMKGTALGSGTTYTATGITSNSQTFTGGWFPSSYDYQDVFHLIGKGPGMDLFLHVNNHVTFAADGTPKVSVSKYTYTCK